MPIWKEFKLCDIFQKIESPKIKKKANDFPEKPDKDHDIPLLTAGIQNQGLSRYAANDDCKQILSNVISISANGANTGACFYQDKPFAILQDAYAIEVKNHTLNRYEGLFLTSLLNKLLHGNHNWSDKAGWSRIKNDIFLFPCKRILTPDWDTLSLYLDEAGGGVLI